MSDLRAMLGKRYEGLATAISTTVGDWLGHDTPSSPHGWRCAQTYRVLPTTWAEGSKHAGLRKLDHLLPDRVEWQMIRGRWRVRWRPPFRFLGTHNDGFWIAEEQDRRDADGDHEWYPFGSWADAIAYADRMARQA